MKHTPGPWVQGSVSGNTLQELTNETGDQAVALVFDKKPKHNKERDRTEYVHTEQGRANVRLIQNAPELYEATKLAIVLLDQIMPQIGKLVIDIGALNQFFITARPTINLIEKGE